MKRKKTNPLALAGVLTILAAFGIWLKVSIVLGVLLAVPGAIMFVVGAVQESEL